ncbi:MAG: GUN4 domain-containing protein [Aulosira sp. ZfuVER01]|nr:GUN4 domain-containing protein [Aulosira sp. ZfuVER01]MDZ8001931.1 GUN4 domain-containing protein [Aulosira sp. DedVER01a]MDZ8055289.1 GUN4 domain-containing protein [Aulosira sp. ZfuCHP01]
MVKNWALVIGINHYDFLQPLKYAKRDAELMQNLLRNEAGFERVFLFSDDSPSIGGKLTRPYRTNLLKFLEQLFEHPFLEPEDNFWFFFSGHGMMYAHQDYLMPADGHPDNIENTGISLKYLTECLRGCGSENIVMMLDACRHQHKQSSEGIGLQTQQLAHKTGVISIVSCSPYESSSEIDALQQGVFTHAILESLGIQGQCATIKRLHQYLSFRVPELLAHYKYPLQTPYINAEPVAKSHRIIIQKYANLQEIANQQINSLPAEVNHSKELAELEQLWIRTITVNTNKINTIPRTAQHLGGDEKFTSKPTVYVSGVNAIAQPQHQSTVTIPEPAIDYLSSERGVDYQRLCELLAAGDWKAADRETLTLMLKVAKREKVGWLDIEAINQFPCTDLYTIDQLWVKYSQGRFGFSVQKRIWESVSDQPDADYETWGKFCDRIGWRVNNNWQFYSDLKFVDNAPLGHFPAAASVDLLNVRQGWVVGLFGCLVGFSALTSRLAMCQ